jgi:hypothetical protein
MPTAPTGTDPSKLDSKLGDREASARRSERTTTPDSPPRGAHGEMAPPGLRRPGAGRAPPDRERSPSPQRAPRPPVNGVGAVPCELHGALP